MVSARTTGWGGAGGGHATNIVVDEPDVVELGEDVAPVEGEDVEDEGSTVTEEGPGPARVPNQAMVAICVIATAARARARTKMSRIIRLTSDELVAVEPPES